MLQKSGVQELGWDGEGWGVTLGAASLAMILAPAFRSTQILHVYVLYILYVYISIYIYKKIYIYASEKNIISMG